jgi:hypothetical protein
MANPLNTRAPLRPPPPGPTARVFGPGTKDAEPDPAPTTPEPDTAMTGSAAPVRLSLPLPSLGHREQFGRAQAQKSARLGTMMPAARCEFCFLCFARGCPPGMPPPSRGAPGPSHGTNELVTTIRLLKEKRSCRRKLGPRRRTLTKWRRGFCELVAGKPFYVCPKNRGHPHQVATS